MIRALVHGAFAVGLLAIGWVGAGYVPGNPLALALVLLIGAFYLLGALELHQFRQATSGLACAVAHTSEPSPSLGEWLGALHPSLQNAVRLRIEGERVALPGPALTPYLTGLLVLLGMLGTFLGMVVTLKGTGLALESATDVEAIRASLAAPVKGLGLAFGSSVAGVAASAMLGLMSALVRRDRLRAAQWLDTRIATTLRGFSQAHQREESLRLLKTQAEMGPALVTQLQALVAQMDVHARTVQERLVAEQSRFHGEAQRAYTGLAESVDRSLKHALTENARHAAATIEPAVHAAMAGLAQESATLRDALAAAAQQQLDGVTVRLDAMAARLAERWQAALADQQRHNEAAAQGFHAGLDRYAQGFEQHAGALLRGVADAHAARDASATAREHERMTAFHDRMASMGEALERSAQAMTAQAASHAQATIAEIARLVEAASQAPRAAAEVIAELRLALSDSLVRDNAALDERVRLMKTLDTLLDAVDHASTAQRSSIDALVRATTDVLGSVGARFADTVDSESRGLRTVSDQLTSSAAEVASLGEGFGLAVQLFSAASEQLATQLQRIETALDHSMARSDEQMAYYVAQAREIIDLTLGSQKQIVEDLQQLAKPAADRPHSAPATSEAGAA